MVTANYAKNSGCWPIIVPIRQTRRVITCQALKINMVLVKYLGLHVPCKYRGPRGYSHMWAIILLPWVPEAFHARFPVSASSESNGHESVALGEKARRKYLKTFVAPFLLTRLTAPGSSTPRMPFRSSRSKTCRPVADEAPHHTREKRTSGTLGLGTTLFTFVETLVTLRPLRRWFTYHPFANIRESQHWERRGQANSRKSKISWLRRQNPQFRPVQRDATLLHVASVCTPCYMLMGSCCGLKPVKLLTRNSRWSVAQQCWICLAALPTLLGPRTRISHGLRGVYKDLRVVSFPRCTPDPNTVGPRVSGVVAHCWPNNVESCSILVGSGGLHP